MQVGEQSRQEPPDELQADGHQDNGDQDHGGDAAKTGFDPVTANGPIFVDWPRPQAAIVISGEQWGYLEPCGCAGLENQKGGLMRRHTFLDHLTEQGWPLATFDLGGQVRRYGEQANIKFSYAVNALAEIGYGAIAFGPQDLRLPIDQLINVAINMPGADAPARSRCSLRRMSGSTAIPATSSLSIACWRSAVAKSASRRCSARLTRSRSTTKPS